MKKSARIHSVNIEVNGNIRFVMALSTDMGLAYYSTSMLKPAAVKVTNAQLKAAFDDLAGVDDAIKHIYANRSKYVGREVEIEIVAQVDPRTKEPVLNPKTGTAFTQVRLVPSSKDVDKYTVDIIWEKIAAGQAKAVNNGEDVHDEDLS